MRDVTVVVPDAAVRVLFLDFDQLPSKAAEALPVVRFRLKKLLPFDADDAMVSYQVMSSEKDSVKLLAVAMPKAVLEEYEAVVLAAGYLPGAVLPSTLAALAGLDEVEAPVLVVNAGLGSVTTAIVQGETLLLHRSFDLSVERFERGFEFDGRLFCRWWIGRARRRSGRSRSRWGRGAGTGLMLRPAMQTSVVETAVLREAEMSRAGREVAQAVSVAAAYFEDSLQRPPDQLLVAGTLGAESLAGDDGREWRGGFAGAGDGGCGDAGTWCGDGECAARLAGRRPGSAEELMRISVNLATRPFVELRPLFARLRLAMGVLALLAVGLGFWLHSLNAKASVAQAKMDDAEGEDAAVSA